MNYNLTTHNNVLLNSIFSLSLSPPLTPPTITCTIDREIFTRESLVFDEQESEGILESPLVLVSLSSSLPVTSDVCESLQLVPEGTLELTEEDECEELMTSVRVSSLVPPDISPHLLTKLETRFIDINNIGEYNSHILILVV